MAAPKQQVWDQITENYRDGPDLTANNKTFASYSLRDSVSKLKASRIHTATTSSNDPFRDRQLWAIRRLAPDGNQFAGFKKGDIFSQLWLTTYPVMAQSYDRLFGDAMLFHVHMSAETIAKPAAVGRASYARPTLRAAHKSPNLSSWYTPITKLEIAPAPASASTSSRNVDANNAQASFIINDGPILRSGVDTLYLDKTFWREYFGRIDQKMNILIPGVYPRDLAQVRKVAVDIAVLRNRDEFAAVARAVGRHLPNITSFTAIVTKIIPRAVDSPKEQLALLEDGLPEVFISFEEKVRLGVHESAALLPNQGIVAANLSRLNLVASLTGALQTGYMLLAYFDDAVHNVHGGSADVDLPSSGQSLVNVQGNAGLQTDNPTVIFESRGQGQHNDPVQPPSASRNRPDSGIVRVTSARRRQSQLRPTTSDANNNDTVRSQYANARPEDTNRVTNFDKTRKQTLRQKSARAPDLTEIPEIQDGRVPFARSRTTAQLARQRSAQEPSQKAFKSDHAGGYVRIPTSGEGALCAWRALEASWNAAIPRLAQATRLPEAALRGMVTVNTLQATLASDFQNPDPVLMNSGVVSIQNFTVDHVARTFSRLVRNRTGLAMELGWIGPLQPSAFGGNDHDLMYVLLGVPEEVKQSQVVTSRLWIWNNNEPLSGHYEGIQDAPEANGPGQSSDVVSTCPTDHSSNVGGRSDEHLPEGKSK